MSELPAAQRLVDLHLANICDFDERGRLTVERTGGSGTPSPRLRLVLAASAHRWFCRADVEDARAEQLNALAASEPVTRTIPAWPRHREAYRDILGASDDDEYGGPAFVLPERPLPDGPAVELGEADRPLLERHMEGWARDFEASRPFGAVVEHGAVGLRLRQCAPPQRGRRGRRRDRGGVPRAGAMRAPRRPSGPR